MAVLNSLFALVAIVAVFLAVFWLLMWAATGWLHVYVAVGVGLCGIGCMVQSIIRGAIVCAQSGVLIPAEPGGGSEGRMGHHCDGPGGAVAYFYIYVLGPLMVLGPIGLFWRFFHRHQTSQAMVKPL